MVELQLPWLSVVPLEAFVSDSAVFEPLFAQHQTVFPCSQTGQGCEARCVGTVSLQQIETRRSQRRTHKVGAGDESDALTIAAGIRVSRATALRVCSSEGDRRPSRFQRAAGGPGHIMAESPNTSIGTRESTSSEMLHCTHFHTF